MTTRKDGGENEEHARTVELFELFIAPQGYTKGAICKLLSKVKKGGKGGRYSLSLNAFLRRRCHLRLILLHCIVVVVASTAREATGVPSMETSWVTAPKGSSLMLSSSISFSSVRTLGRSTNWMLLVSRCPFL